MLRHYPPGTSGVSFRKPKEFTVRESAIGDRRVFSALQVEAMDDGAQDLANKMINGARAQLRSRSFSERNRNHMVVPFLGLGGTSRGPKTSVTHGISAHPF